MKIQLSDAACSSCGTRHQVDLFEPGARVHTRCAKQGPRNILQGEAGTVIEWRAWPQNAVWVRVQFGDGYRENFDPCELEHQLECDCGWRGTRSTLTLHPRQGFGVCPRCWSRGYEQIPRTAVERKRRKEQLR